MSFINENMAQFIKEHDKFMSICDEDTSHWLSDVRKKAINHVSTKGLPSTKLESWRYTNIKPILDESFFFQASPNITLSESDCQKHILGDMNMLKIVILDGNFVPELSDVNDIKGLEIFLFNTMNADQKESIKHLLKYNFDDDTTFESLNLAHLNKGLCFKIHKNVNIEKPIHLLFISSHAQKEKSQLIFPHCLVIADENSSVEIRESYVGYHNTGYLHNSVAQYFLKKNASIKYIKLQNDSTNAFHIHKMYIHLEDHSCFDSYIFSLGAKIARTSLHAVFKGENASFNAHGSYVGKGTQHHAINTFIDHTKPHCKSKISFYGILDDHSSSIFDSTIHVHKNAQKSLTEQNNYNLLLNKNVTSNIRPQLFIDADDVKCTHGATVGQINPEHVFYMQTRGIDKKTVQQELMISFASQILDLLKDVDLSSALKDKIHKKLSSSL